MLQPTLSLLMDTSECVQLAVLAVEFYRLMYTIVTD